jgi:hypothetical protein
MHRTKLVFGLTALFLTAGIVVVAAQQGHGSAPKAKPAAAPAPKAPSVKPVPHAVQPAAAQAKATQPKTMKAAPVAIKTAPIAKSTPAAQVKPAKATSAATVKAAATKPENALKPAATKVAKVEKPEAPKASKTEKATSKSAATTKATAPVASTTPVSTTQLTPVQEKLKKNTNLAAKLTSGLPAGTDLMTAAAGFRNLGQFVAAVNVSNNLGVSFTQLKAKMVTANMSLGQAIQAVRPLTASATIEAQRAEYDARGMIAESELTPQVPAPTTTSTSSKTKAKAKTPAK